MIDEIKKCPVCELEMPPNNKFCSYNCYKFFNGKITQEEWQKNLERISRWKA